MITIKTIAQVAHEANRSYCRTIGDYSQLPWNDAPEWQKESAMKGVGFVLSNPDSTPEDSHNSWLKEKRENGWKYGEVKDPEAKTHPCFVEYDQLPPEQRAKDYLFRNVVLSFKDFI